MIFFRFACLPSVARYRKAHVHFKMEQEEVFASPDDEMAPLGLIAVHGSETPRPGPTDGSGIDNAQVLPRCARARDQTVHGLRTDCPLLSRATVRESEETPRIRQNSRAGMIAGRWDVARWSRHRLSKCSRRRPIPLPPSWAAPRCGGPQSEGAAQCGSLK